MLESSERAGGSAELVRRATLPIFRPYYDEREEAAVASVLRSGWVGPGPVTQEFEERFAERVGARYAVALSSGTAALQIALRLAGVGPGDEVLVPSLSFVATAMVASQEGARAVLCDVEEDTLLLDPADARRRSSSPRAAIAVLHGGRPFAEPLDLGDATVIYDCAHAAGARFDAGGKLCCWSFNAVKNLATGEGGMITTDDEELARRAARLRWHGIDRTTWDRAHGDGYRWEYDIREVGFKYPMGDIAAALGVTQLEKLDEMQELRDRHVRQYLAELDGVPGIRLPEYDGDSSWHLFVVRVAERDRVAAHLQAHGIDTGVHYKPLHLYPLYRTPYGLPVAERAWPTLLTLPLFPGMTSGDVSHVAATLRGAVAQAA